MGSVAARRPLWQPLKQGSARGAGPLLLLVLGGAGLAACGNASSRPPSTTIAPATAPNTLPGPASPTTEGLVTSSTNQDGATSTCTAAVVSDHPTPGSSDELTVTSALPHATVLVTVHAPTGTTSLTTATQTSMTSVRGLAYLQLSISRKDAGKFLVVAADVGSSATCFTTLQVAP